MKKIELLFLKKSNTVLTFLLGLLGALTGCPRMEYGTGPSSFIGGKVVAEDQSVLEKIKVTAVVTSGYQEVTFTGADGKFNLELVEAAPPFKLKFQDVDSLQNGWYEDKDTTINKVTKDLSIVLKAKKINKLDN